MLQKRLMHECLTLQVSLLMHLEHLRRLCTTHLRALLVGIRHALRCHLQRSQ